MTSLLPVPAVTGSTGSNYRWLPAARAAWWLVLAAGAVLIVYNGAQNLAVYQTACSGLVCGNIQLTPRQALELRQLGLPLIFLPGYYWALNLVRLLVFVAVGAVIFWRKSHDPLALFTSFTLILFGIGGTLDLPPQVAPGLRFVSQLFQAVGSACLAFFFIVFPDGRFVPPWTRWLAVVAVAREVLEAFVFNPIVEGLFFLVAPLVLLLQVYRYRRVSNAVQRQQTKWVVFGSLLGVGLYTALLLFLQLLAARADQLSVVENLALLTGLSLSLALVPISIGAAILRSRLWDIDVLIRRTLVYAVLTGLLALLYLGLVVAGQSVLGTLTSQQSSELVTVISTLAIAALFVPLRRRVQALIDRRFYRRKVDAAQILAAFNAAARDEVDLDRLTEELVQVVQETMQPAGASLWLSPARASQANDQPDNR